MAKNNNLTDFLTNTAAAIREVEGSTDPINPQDFEAKIKALKQSGGAAEGDITFYDYDGTIVTSWSLDKLSTATSLPNLPEHDGLICEGWNWTLADLQATNRKMDVGAMYITDDGKTRLYITIAAEGRMDVPLNLQATTGNGVIIDWGDGSAAETKEINGTVRHTYAAAGDYMITLEPTTNCTLYLSTLSPAKGLMNDDNIAAYADMLQKVELGASVSFQWGKSFHQCHSLKTITMPSYIKKLGNSLFQDCYSLLGIVIPSGISEINSGLLYKCYTLTKIILPTSITTLTNSNTFASCNISSITLPNNLTEIGQYAFRYCKSLTNIIIPNSCKTISASAFEGTGLREITIADGGVHTTGQYVFSSCYSLTKAMLENSSIRSIDGMFAYDTSLSYITLPSTTLYISGMAFYQCYSLTNIVIPASCTSIQGKAFAYCTSMKIYDFTQLTRVPTLGSTEVFTSIPSDCKIRVPAALYDTWIAATNWSTYASYIEAV
jgi:hypothetical protein